MFDFDHAPEEILCGLVFVCCEEAHFGLTEQNARAEIQKLAPDAKMPLRFIEEIAEDDPIFLTARDWAIEAMFKGKPLVGLFVFTPDSTERLEFTPGNVTEWRHARNRLRGLFARAA